MNRTLIWKFGFVTLLVVMCGLSVWPPEKKLKPGIDLAGGTSLLYQIDTTGMENWEKREIAQNMIRILRQRIDPGNKRNLVWRPHGSDRIEIQMPLATEKSRQLRKTYQEKIEVLEDYNVNMRRIRQAFIRPTEKSEDEYRADRDKKLEKLAGNSQGRLEILRQLGKAYDNLEAGNARREKSLETKNLLDEKFAEAKINQSRADSLYQRWDKLDDPNRAAELKKIAGEDQNSKLLLEQYIGTRQELRDVRIAITNKEDGLAVLEQQAWDNLEQANIDIVRLEKFLAAPKGKRRTEIEQLKSDHPEAAVVLDELVVVYDVYAKVAGRLDDPEDLKRQLRGSGVLEFRILPLAGGEDLSEAEVKNYIERLANYGPKREIDEKTSPYVWKEIKDTDEFGVSGAIRGEFADEQYLLCSNQPDETLLRETGPDQWRLQNARLDTDDIGNWAVAFGFNEIGARRFWNLTKNNIQRPLCILLDNEAVSAPNIKTAIRGRGQITGRYSQTEAMDLIDKLNAGSLPARLSDQPISVNTIGPTMGRDNLQSGLTAGIYGMIAVAGFMLIYYLVAGSLANIALFMNLLFIIGVMAFSRATFTMPGIAGLILTIGMAVDANVLIFERIREEQKRGSSLRIAIKNGYERAFRTILDANATTFIVALILWVLASEEVKGFALTLMIGIVSSMFTALFVTRMVFDFLLDRKIIKNQLRMLQIIGRPNVNWLGKRSIFWTISVLMIIGGWVIYLGRGEENPKYSIEFTGGTSIHAVLTKDGAESMFSPEELNTLDEEGRAAQLREKMEQAIRVEGERIENPLLMVARVQQIGPAERREFEMVTTETNHVKVTLNLGADNKQTAAEIENTIRQAAADAGDRRLETAEVKVLDESLGTFLMVTGQTNVNKINQVLSQALPIEIKLTLGEATKMTAADVEKAVREKALELEAEVLAKATVEPFDTAGMFRILTSQTNRSRIGRVLNLAFPQAHYTISSKVMNIETDPVVNNAVRKALAGKLDVLTNLSPTVRASEPITDELISQKSYLSEYKGGLLLKFDFGVDKTELRERLDKRFEQSRYKEEFEQYGHNKAQWFPAENEAVTDETQLKGIELVVVSDVVYEGENNEEWKSFVNNETERFSEILKWETSLPRVTQIDPSVGRKSMNDALIATVISLLAIVAYIWIRFGDVRFGMAAVAALVHDVSIAMGLVAASAWLSQSSIGRFLLISDFKIDLPMIAAFLTVIGYSLNDTIVVFDRIRENRGKLATLSLGIINDSINQTISRTLLTSMTTLVVLVVMYIWGGPGLRSFNYVLIIGVLVGTYSSIGIAAPLLYGAKAEPKKKTKTVSDKK